MIRLFAALALPPEIGEALVARQSGLPGARWRPEEALHVTLRFFGDIDERKADDLDLELEAISAKPFEVEIRGVGSFGEGWRIDTLWAGVEPSEPLQRLHGRCESAARKAGLKPETRTYRPHVTLAYLSGSPQDKVAAWIGDNNLLHPPPFRVDRFGLYSSVLSSEGSRYQLEREYRLS
jgi:2'-5' RNA ligase